MAINHGPELIAFLELISLNAAVRGWMELVYGIHLDFISIPQLRLELIAIPYGNQINFCNQHFGLLNATKLNASSIQLGCNQGWDL